MQKVGENSQMVFKSVSLFGIIAATVLALASAIAVAGERDSFTTARGETIDLPAVHWPRLILITASESVVRRRAIAH